MKPVGPNTALAQIIDDQALMMVNWRLVGIRYIRQLLAFTTANITTPRGTSLSMELWNMIIRFVLVDTKDSFCFVQGISQRKSSMGNILHCRRVMIEIDPLGDIHCAESVESWEGFMSTPNQFTSPIIEPALVREPTFDIFITPVDYNLPVESACLFSNLTVPDVISYMENGACSWCGNRRIVCPGCGDRGEAFGLRMGCGVELVCPLCIGLDIAQDHKTFLLKYYRNDPPEEEEKLLADRIWLLVDELGYEWMF